jgi:hypothetical protein
MWGLGEMVIEETLEVVEGPVVVMGDPRTEVEAFCGRRETPGLW